MEKSKVIQLFKSKGKVKVGDREFTKLLGGFNEKSPVITDKQFAELLGYKKGARAIRENLNREDKGNKTINYFTKDDILDLKIDVADNDNNILLDLGYSKMEVGKANNIYVFSEAGFLLYLKFAEGENAISLYKDFVEDYFQTKARIEVLEKSLEQELEELIKDRKIIAGELIYSESEEERFSLSLKRKNIDDRIENIKVSIATRDKDKLLEEYKPKVDFANSIETSATSIDFKKFADVLSIKGFGRNKLFEWMRAREYLNGRNEPYRKYIEQGLFETKESTYIANGQTKISIVSYVTGKGQLYFQKKINEYFNKAS